MPVFGCIVPRHNISFRGVAAVLVVRRCSFRRMEKVCKNPGPPCDNRVDHTPRRSLTVIPDKRALPDDMNGMLSAERPRLVRLCASLAGAPSVAEDLAQETLLEAWRSLPRLADRQALAPWLSGIARNVCLRWRRRHGRE